MFSLLMYFVRNNKNKDDQSMMEIWKKSYGIFHYDYHQKILCVCVAKPCIKIAMARQNCMLV